MTIDLLPTLAKLAGAPVSAERIIDGKDIWPLLAGQPNAAKSARGAYFYWGQRAAGGPQRQVEAALPAPLPVARAGRRRRQAGQVRAEEDRAVALRPRRRPRRDDERGGRNPDVVKRLLEFVERAREDLGDALTKREGKNVRPSAGCDEIEGRLEQHRLGQDVSGREGR